MSPDAESATCPPDQREPTRHIDRLRPLLDRMTRAVVASDASEFERLLDDMVRARRPEWMSQVGRINAALRVAVGDFKANSALLSVVSRDDADVGEALDSVIRFTDGAAHNTMALIERSLPLVDALGRGGPADTPQIEALRRNLTDMHLEQGFQDRLGQILRSLTQLVHQVEDSVSGLEALAADGESAAPGGAERRQVEVPADFINNQHDVDSLLSSLGL